MSSDPLAQADIWTGAPSDTEYDAVYAAVTGTERGRWFLTEYANRNRHADTQLLADALARIEAAIARKAPAQAANGAAPLAAITATAGETVTVEAVVDTSLNGKSVAAATADDAANDDAPVVGLHELAENKKFAEAVAALASQLTMLGEETEPPPSLHENAESAAELQSIQAEIVMPPADYTPVVPPPPAKAEAPSAPRWYIEPPDFLFRPTDREPHHDEIALPAPQLTSGPHDDPADLFEPQGGGAVVQVVNGAALHAAPQPTLNELLVGLRGLSEDELIALFG
jgi:hypothetical protein